MSDCDKEKDKEKEGGPGFVERSLFESRQVLICSEINQKVARAVASQLLALAAQSDDDITLFINSQGGHVEAGDTIHDMIRFVKPRVRIVGTGWVASAGAHIFLAVDKKDRFCLPNTRFLLHQPSGGSFGAAQDIDIEAQEILRMRERLNRIIAERTGQPYEKVAEDTDRNLWLGPKEAKEYGLLGTVIETNRELK